jgi:hypothetical protein
LKKCKGHKAGKKKVKDPHIQEMDARHHTPKAFAIQSVAKDKSHLKTYLQVNRSGSSKSIQTILKYY